MNISFYFISVEWVGSVSFLLNLDQSKSYINISEEEKTLIACETK